MSYKIEGLSVIRPKEPVQTFPGSMSDKEVDSLVRFWDKPQCDPTKPEIAAALKRIQAACQWIADVGRNPDMIGIEDFDIAVLKDGKTDQQHPEFVPDGKGCLFRSKTTGRDVYVDLVAPPGANQDSYDRTTAFNLVRIGSK